MDSFLGLIQGYNVKQTVRPNRTHYSSPGDYLPLLSDKK